MAQKIFYTIFFNILFSSLLLASSNEKTNIQRYTIDDGLSSNNIQDVFQDSKGFLWIGTDDGLNRYDGYEFKIYRYNINKPTGIIGNNITFISEDYDKNIWIGVDGKGICLKENDSDNFLTTHSLHDNFYQNSKNKINSILKDEQNSFWIIFNNFLAEYIFKTEDKTIYNIDFAKETSTIFCGAPISSKRLLLGSSEGLLIFDKEELSTTKINIKSKKRTVNCEVYDIINLKNDNYLIGTNRGIYIYNLESGVTEVFKKSFSSIIFSQKSDDEVWIGCGNVISVFNTSSNKFINNVINLPEEVSITSIVQDNSGILWVGTTYDGIFKISINQKKFLRNSFFELSTAIKSNNITSIQSENDSIAWLVTDFNEIIKFDIFSNKVLLNRKINNNIKLNRLFNGANDNLWIGTNKGIYVIDESSVDFVKPNTTWSKTIADNLSDVSIFHYAKDSNNICWFASLYDIYSISKDSLFTKYEIGLSDNLEVIKSLLIDSKGNLLVVTNSSLLYFNYQEHRFLPIKTETFLQRQILSVANGFDDRIWLGTQIGLYKTSRITQDSIAIEAVKGIGDKKVNSVIVDKRERVWCAFNNSVAMLLLDGGIRIFDKNDGISSKMLNNNSAGYLPSGNVLFGGIDGLYWSNPDSINYNNHKPPIETIEVSVCYKGTKHAYLTKQDDMYKAKYRLGMVLNFKFAALDFTQSKKNNYQYYLEGYDSSWHSPTTSNTISYNNLTAGRYLLKVRASNNDFVWADEMLEIPITITSPLWLSRFAYLFYAFILIFIIQMLVNYRTRHYTRANKILKENSDDRTKLQEKQDELSRIHLNVTDSINYALRIQHAMMPSYDKISKILPNSFVYFRPKDIVSGDFYWIYETKNHKYIAIVDCTGHGVPGGFMSIIGMDLLKHSIIKNEETEPGIILDIINSELIHTLGNSSDSGREDIKDAMDLSLCVINKNTKTLCFAGAVHDLYQIRNDELTIYKGDRRVIGSTDTNENDSFRYSTKVIKLEPNDKFYMFTDGYADQFGGADSKKYMYRRFRHLLLNIHKLDFEAQREIIHKNFEDWRGKEEQVDDVLVFGFQP